MMTPLGKIKATAENIDETALGVVIAILSCSESAVPSLLERNGIPKEPLLEAGEQPQIVDAGQIREKAPSRKESRYRKSPKDRAKLTSIIRAATPASSSTDYSDSLWPSGSPSFMQALHASESSSELFSFPDKGKVTGHTVTTLPISRCDPLSMANVEQSLASMQKRPVSGVEATQGIFKPEALGLATQALVEKHADVGSCRRLLASTIGMARKVALNFSRIDEGTNLRSSAGNEFKHLLSAPDPHRRRALCTCNDPRPHRTCTKRGGQP